MHVGREQTVSSYFSFLVSRGKKNPSQFHFHKLLVSFTPLEMKEIKIYIYIYFYVDELHFAKLKSTVPERPFLISNLQINFLCSHFE